MLFSFAVSGPTLRPRPLSLALALAAALPVAYAMIHAATPAPARAALPLGFALLPLLGFAAAAALLTVRGTLAADPASPVLARVLGLIALFGGLETLAGLMVGAVDPQRPAAPGAVPFWVMHEALIPAGLALASLTRTGLAPADLRRRLGIGLGALLVLGLFAVAAPTLAIDIALPLLVTAGLATTTLLLLRCADGDPLAPFLALLSAGVALDAALVALGLPVFTLGWYAVRGLECAAAAALPVLLTLDLARRALELAACNRTLARVAERDPLTGLANRRSFDAGLARELIRARRSGQSLALIMIDIDYFKRYNDGYGHLAGDACLRAVAGAIGGAARRPGDLAVRYGGEEFALVLPETDMKGAICIAEALQAALAALDLPHAGSPVGQVTVSMGIALAARAEPVTPDMLVGEADRALYAAKACGRARWASAA